MGNLILHVEPEVTRIAALGKRLGVCLGARELTPEVYALAILKYGPNTATRMLQSVGIEPSLLLGECQQLVVDQTKQHESCATVGFFEVGLADECEAMIKAASSARELTKANRIGCDHLLIGIVRTTPPVAAVLMKAGVSLDKLEAALKKRHRPKQKKKRPPSRLERAVAGADGGQQAQEGTGPIARYCTDLVKLAVDGKLDPVIGRDRETDRLITTLLRKKKSNPLLVGPAGVGKTAVVEGLAQRIADGRVPNQLRGKNVYTLDLAALVGGSIFRGQFEGRLKALMKALKQVPGAMLFCDEVHMLLGAGAAQSTMDAANILKPALARGEICCIGATTTDEYREVFAKDKALDRRFQRIDVDEPSAEETLQILAGIRPGIEQHHGCKIDDSGLQATVELTGRHVAGRHFPDKAIDAIDEACARHRETDQPIGRHEVAQTIAEQVGVPPEVVLACDDDRATLVRTQLERLVVGQTGAIDAVARAIQRAFSPLRDSGRPLASMLFAGPSSAGKSYVAQVLSDALYATPSLIRVNLAEYGEKHAISRLLGASPGYIGHGDANQLTDPIRRRPHSVVLFDNADKAHPEVITALMEILERGMLTDAQGNEVSFRSAVVIITTVAGSDEQSRGGIGFDGNDDDQRQRVAQERITSACRSHFGDEFINRVDAIVPFNVLTVEDLQSVAKLAIQEINARLVPMQRSVTCSSSTLKHIAANSANARLVHATIRNEIEPLIVGALRKPQPKRLRVHVGRDGYTIK